MFKLNSLVGCCMDIQDGLYIKGSVKYEQKNSKIHCNLRYNLEHEIKSIETH